MLDALDEGKLGCKERLELAELQQELGQGDGGDAADERIFPGPVRKVLVLEPSHLFQQAVQPANRSPRQQMLVASLLGQQLPPRALEEGKVLLVGEVVEHPAEEPAQHWVLIESVVDVSQPALHVGYQLGMLLSGGARAPLVQVLEAQGMLGQHVQI
eukprot:UN3580